MSIETNLSTNLCPRCKQAMRPSLVKTAIWQSDRLFVVEDVPAQVCDFCLEQFYDDETTEALRKLTEDGFPATKAKREILVPIFTLEGHLLSASNVSNVLAKPN